MVARLTPCRLMTETELAFCHKAERSLTRPGGLAKIVTDDISDLTGLNHFV